MLATTELSADTALILLVLSAGALSLGIGALVGWILRDRRERKSPQPDDALRLHEEMYHPGRTCRENVQGACVDRFGDDRLTRRKA